MELIASHRYRGHISKYITLLLLTQRLIYLAFISRIAPWSSHIIFRRTYYGISFCFALLMKIETHGTEYSMVFAQGSYDSVYAE